MASLEQRYAIMFCVKLNNSAIHTYELIERAYGASAPSRGSVFEWHRRFKEGQEDVEDDQGRGRPNTSINQDSIKAVETTIRENPRLSVRKVGALSGISKSSANSILTEQLGMRRLSAKWVPDFPNPIAEGRASQQKSGTI